MSGIVRIELIAGRSLGAKDKGQGTYALVQFEQQEDKTPVSAKAVSPQWNYKVSFDVTTDSGSFEITIFEKERFKKDSFLGQVHFELTQVLDKPNETVDRWYPLQPRPKKKKDRIVGDIYMRVTYIPSKNKVTLDDFELMTVIGKGGFGKVMQVRKKDTDRIYAMKIIRKDTVIKKNKVEQTKAEKNILQAIDHPFIVGLKYSFQTEDKLYLVLDYVNGGELFFHLKKEFRFSEDRVRFYAAELVLALQHLHDNGIIYRDLKPENILINRSGHLLVCDFGLVKSGMYYGNITHTFCGTPEYLAPEMLLGEGYGTSVDWWSMGSLVFEMLTGLPPYYSENVREMYEKILTEPLTFPPYISEEAKDLLAGLLERNPSRRLGGKPEGAREMFSHPFFASIDWDALVKLELEAPVKPDLESESDFKYIDREFTQEPAVDSVVEHHLAPVPKDAFVGFSYNMETDNAMNRPAAPKEANLGVELLKKKARKAKEKEKLKSKKKGKE